MWVDSHCHLTSADYTKDIDTVLKNARAAGVEHFLTIACDVDEFEAMASFAALHADVSMTVGVHPHEATKTLERFTPSALYTVLEEAAKNPNVIGLGEMGYDYYYNHSITSDQERVFDIQLQLAAALGLSISIHTRNAEADTLKHLKRYPTVTGVIHCFSGTEALALGALELGYYISLSGIITFPKAQDIRDALKHVPLDRMLLETDAPYLAPVPHRGKRNEPAFLLETAKVIAHIKGVTLEEVAHVTTSNFYKIFPKN